MVEACLSAGLVTDGVEFQHIQSILRKDDVELLVAVRALAKCLYGVMRGGDVNYVGTSKSYSSINNSSSSDSSDSNDSSYNNNNDDNNSNSSTDFKKVTTDYCIDKHIIVSLGDRGVLWYGPRTANSRHKNNEKKKKSENEINFGKSSGSYREITGEYRDVSESSPAGMMGMEEGAEEGTEEGTRVAIEGTKGWVEEGSDCTGSWMFVPAIGLPQGNGPVSTNGAGDAFCGGFIHAMLKERGGEGDGERGGEGGGEGDGERGGEGGGVRGGGKRVRKGDDGDERQDEDKREEEEMGPKKVQTKDRARGVVMWGPSLASINAGLRAAHSWIVSPN